MTEKYKNRGWYIMINSKINGSKFFILLLAFSLALPAHIYAGSPTISQRIDDLLERGKKKIEDNKGAAILAGISLLSLSTGLIIFLGSSWRKKITNKAPEKEKETKPDETDGKGKKDEVEPERPKTFNQPTMIGNSSCLGVERKIDENTTLKQVLVKNQFESDGGGIPSCGYHALKNAKFIVESLQNGGADLAAKLNDTKFIADHFGSENGIWKKMVQEDEKKFKTKYTDDNFNWLDSMGLDFLLQKLDIPAVVVQSSEWLSDVGEGARMMDDFDMYPKDMKIRLAEKKPLTVAYIVSTTEEKHDKNFSQEDLRAGKQSIKAGDPGHWFTVVFHQDAKGKWYFIVANSVNSQSGSTDLDNELVKKLMRYIKRRFAELPS